MSAATIAKRVATLGRPLRVAYVGAGAINFGGAEGPWDHATRVEGLAKDGVAMDVVGIADPSGEAATRVLTSRSAGPAGAMYSSCQLFPGYQQMLADARPDVVFLGTPPHTRGTSTCPVELDCVNAGAHVFVEKPIANSPLQEVLDYSEELVAAQAAAGAVVSVGYMFRYNRAVQKAREIVATDGGGKVMAVLARYNAAYAAIDHPFWWDVAQSGGPIVEQATHFIDLARFFGGDVALDTVSGVSIPATHPTGALACIPSVVDESTIPVERRLPRVHSSTWRFNNGAVGTLTHGLLLQGEAYDTGFEVWCDGLRVAFEDLYDADKCRIRVRRGSSDEDEVFEFGGDDMYHNEIAAFLEDAAGVMTGEGSGQSSVLSSFADAAKSYQLSMLVTDRCKPASSE